MVMHFQCVEDDTNMYLFNWNFIARQTVASSSTSGIKLITAVRWKWDKTHKSVTHKSMVT